jgi:hypothetical protein
MLKDVADAGLALLFHRSANFLVLLKVCLNLRTWVPYPFSRSYEGGVGCKRSSSRRIARCSL